MNIRGVMGKAKCWEIINYAGALQTNIQIAGPLLRGNDWPMSSQWLQLSNAVDITFKAKFNYNIIHEKSVFLFVF